VTHQTSTTPGPTAIEPSSAFTSFVLRQLRISELQARIAANEFRTAALALNTGLIDPDGALAMLAEAGLVGASS
jgi:hypothetical protein